MAWNSSRKPGFSWYRVTVAVDGPLDSGSENKPGLLRKMDRQLANNLRTGFI